MEPIGIQEKESIDTRDFLRIASWSTALGFGCMGIAVTSLRADTAGFWFQWTLWSAAAFVVGAAFGYFCWKLAAAGRAASRLGFALLAVVGFAGFLYPLRFVPKERLPDVALGLAGAAAVISTGAYLIWRLSRFLEAENSGVEENDELPSHNGQSTI